MIKSKSTNPILNTKNRQRKFKVINYIVGILVFALTILLIITAPFATDFFALTPIGLLSFIVILFVGGYHFTRWLHYRLNHKKHRSNGALAIILLLNNSILPSTHVPDNIWNMMMTNFQLMGNPSAWQASFELNWELGLLGVTPLVYRPLVIEHPVTLVAIPGQTVNSFEPFAVVSGLQAVQLANDSAIWNTIPQQSLPVQQTILLTDFSNPTSLNRTAMGMLAINCTECRGVATQLNVNPRYLGKLALETSLFVVGQMPLKEGSKWVIGDAIAATHIATDLVEGELGAAGAKSAGWGGGKLAGVLLEETASWLSAGTSFITDKSIQHVLDPTVSKSGWNWQIYDASAGIAKTDYESYAWQFEAVHTFSGSIFGNDWKVETQGRVQFEYRSSVELPSSPAELPPLFQENVEIFSQSPIFDPNIRLTNESWQLNDFENPFPVPDQTNLPQIPGGTDSGIGKEIYVPSDISPWIPPDTSNFDIPPTPPLTIEQPSWDSSGLNNQTFGTP